MMHLKKLNLKMSLVIEVKILDQNTEIKQKKEIIYENTGRLIKGRQKVLNGFESKMFSMGKIQKEKVVLNLKRSDKCVALSNRSINYT